MNIKKLFPEKQGSKKGVLEFLDKKGFYIVLILCIAIVGAVAVFVTTYNITSSNNDFDAQKIIPEETQSKIAEDSTGKTAQSSLSTEVANQVQKETANKSTTINKTVAQNISPAQTNSKPTAAPVQPGKVDTTKSKTPAKVQKFIMPVFGTVTFEYAQDKLVYSKTLEEWGTHSGVDLAADRGTPVKAVADGVVSDVKSDPRLGIVVILKHEDGTKTVYANLASDDMVSPNQRVKQGDVIGSVGNSASFETSEQAHLHFEVLKNDQPADPLAYLPKNK